jgi:hypothetical protein
VTDRSGRSEELAVNSRVRPDVASEQLDLEGLRTAYLSLMVSYNLVLGEASRVGRQRISSLPQPKKWRANRLMFGPLVRLLVGSHIRKQLNTISVRCAQLELTLDSNRDAARRDWLKEARKSAELAATSLPSLGLISIVVPLVPSIGALVAAVVVGFGRLPGLSLLGVAYMPWLGDSIVIVVMSTVLGIAYVAYRELRQAFRHKREMFMPGATQLDREPVDTQGKYDGQNIYKDEDSLFTMLGSSKSSEAELDKIARTLLILLFVEVIAIGALALSFDPLALLSPGRGYGLRLHHAVWAFLIAIVAVPFAVMFFREVSRRVWR